MTLSGVGQGLMFLTLKLNNYSSNNNYIIMIFTRFGNMGLSAFGGLLPYHGLYMDRSIFNTIFC